MKTNLTDKLVIFLMALFFISCSEDEMDSIFVRTDGEINVTVVDSEGNPVTDAKVRLFNYYSENEITNKITDESGTVEFGRFQSGVYAVAVEVSHSNEWFNTVEEVHIVSGTTLEHIVNLGEQYGSVNIKLYNSNQGNIVNPSNNIDYMLVPNNDAYKAAIDQEEMLSLANHTIEAGSVVEQSDIPVANYVMFTVVNDTLVINQRNISIERGENIFINEYIDYLRILLVSKEEWLVTSITASTPEDENPPFYAFRFDYNSNDLEVEMENGDIITGDFYFGGSGFQLGLSDPNYNFYFYETSYELRTDNSLVLNFNYIDMYDYTQGQGYYAQDVAITLR